MGYLGKLEDGGQATVDELIEVNLGTDEEPRPTYISALLSVVERDTMCVARRVTV